MWKIYGKGIMAGLVLVVTAVQAALSDSATGGRITNVEGIQICIAVCNALLVYLVPAVPRWPWSKVAISAVLAALQLATSLVVDGIGSADASALLLAALMVLAGTAPARSTVGPASPAARNVGVFDGPSGDGPRELR